MKTFILVLLMTPALLAQPDFSVITKALNTGNASILAEHFDENVELIVLDEEGIYGKSQAAQIVKKFFSEYPPKSFKLVHQGTNNKSLHYCIGDMMIGKETYRVSFYLKKVGDQYLIQELGIEED